MNDGVMREDNFYRTEGRSGDPNSGSAGDAAGDAAAADGSANINNTNITMEDGTNVIIVGGEDSMNEMGRNLAPYWNLFVLRGMIVLGFGLFFWTYPNDSLDIITKVFAAFLILEGAANLLKLFIVLCCTDSPSMLCVYFCTFLVNTVLGSIILAHPNETINLVLAIMAIWFLLIGLLQLCLAGLFYSANVHGPDGLVGFIGLLYMIIGIVLFTHMSASVTFIVKFVGIIITLFGLQLVLVGCRLRSMIPPNMPEYHSSEFTSIIHQNQHQNQNQPANQGDGEIGRSSMSTNDGPNLAPGGAKDEYGDHSDHVVISEPV